MDRTWIATIIASMIGSGGFGATVTWLLGKLDRRNPIREGVKTLLFLRLREIRQRMTTQHGTLSIDDKRVAEQIHESYHAAGGNHLGDAMIDEIRHAPLAEGKHLQERRQHPGAQTP